MGAVAKSFPSLKSGCLQEVLFCGKGNVGGCVSLCLALWTNTFQIGRYTPHMMLKHSSRTYGGAGNLIFCAEFAVYPPKSMTISSWRQETLHFPASLVGERSV